MGEKSLPFFRGDITLADIVLVNRSVVSPSRECQIRINIADAATVIAVGLTITRAEEETQQQ